MWSVKQMSSHCGKITIRIKFTWTFSMSNSVYLKKRKICHLDLPLTNDINVIVEQLHNAVYAHVVIVHYKGYFSESIVRLSIFQIHGIKTLSWPHRFFFMYQI